MRGSWLAVSFLALFILGCITQAEQNENAEGITAGSSQPLLPASDVAPQIGPSDNVTVARQENATAPNPMPENLAGAFAYSRPLNCSISEEGELVQLRSDLDRVRIDLLETSKLRGLNGIIYDGSAYFVWGSAKAITYSPVDVTNVAEELNFSSEDLGIFDVERIQNTYKDAIVVCEEWEPDEAAFEPPPLDFINFRELFPIGG